MFITMRPKSRTETCTSTLGTNQYRRQRKKKKGHQTHQNLHSTRNANLERGLHDPPQPFFDGSLGTDTGR